MSPVVPLLLLCIFWDPERKEKEEEKLMVPFSTLTFKTGNLVELLQTFLELVLGNLKLLNGGQNFCFTQSDL